MGTLCSDVLNYRDPLEVGMGGILEQNQGSVGKGELMLLGRGRYVRVGICHI